MPNNVRTLQRTGSFKRHSGTWNLAETMVAYHLHGQTGRFGQMASKFPYWENSFRDWRLPFAEIPTIYQKNLHDCDG